MMLQNDNLKVISINKINSKKEDENKKKQVFLMICLKNLQLKNINAPQIINFNNKYYLVDLKKLKKIRPYNDIEVQEALNAQLNFTNKIEKNSSILKDISMGAFDKDKLEKFASDNGLMIKEYEINNFKQNEIFQRKL